MPETQKVSIVPPLSVKNYNAIEEASEEILSDNIRRARISNVRTYFLLLELQLFVGPEKGPLVGVGGFPFSPSSRM